MYTVRGKLRAFVEFCCCQFARPDVVFLLLTQSALPCDGVKCGASVQYGPVSVEGNVLFFEGPDVAGQCGVGPLVAVAEVAVV